MRCPKPCGTPMDSSADRLTHSCPACGIVTRLTDTGYLPSAGYVPSPYRTPAKPFQPLPDELREDEKGWPQTGPSVYDAAVKRPHPARLPNDHPDRIAWTARIGQASAGSQRERRAWERANGLTVASEATRKSWATRRAS